MIEVRHLTKQYGDHVAVDDLSFTLAGGKIYGFLGPNGAGKSTTMNMITGCLAPTSGEVFINGASVQDDPQTAKSAIGYLPEIPPLYTDMTPREYLTFVAEAKGVMGEDVRRQVDAALAETHLVDMQDRLIRNLSKGYKQRVGIAQAMLGDPDIIILDEPTVGLDPAQIIEIRSLIRRLGKKKTVILSSHILQEISAVCDHVLIITHGKLVANNHIEKLGAYLGAKSVLTLRARGERARIDHIVEKIEGVTGHSVRMLEPGHWEYKLDAPSFTDRICEKIFFAFADARIALLSMSANETSLEDVFLRLTGGTDSTQSTTDTSLLFGAEEASANKVEKKARPVARKKPTPAPKREKQKKQAPGSYTSIFGDDNEQGGKQ